jgi:hypothetical protein
MRSFAGYHWAKVKRSFARGGVGLLLLLASSFQQCLALVGSEGRGSWPNDWPAELEPFRKQARTLMVATASQENIYEIQFSDRADFERAWPGVVKVMSKGSILRLYSPQSPPPPGLFRTFLTNAVPAVRIYAPAEPGREVQIRASDGKMKRLILGPPWPKHVLTTNGELPEWVIAEEVDGVMTWVATPLPGSPDQIRGFHYRARVDVDLVVDGTVIDTSRIQMPQDIRVIDKRSNAGTSK